MVVSYDDDDAPTATSVHFFQADRLLKAFDVARQARLKRGLKVSDNTGMWVALHAHPSLPDNDNFEVMADWVIRTALPRKQTQTSVASAPPPQGLSIAEAKIRLAAYYDVAPQAIEIIIRG
jgi:hypothetical protein